jgi:hypothetical protein
VPNTPSVTCVLGVEEFRPPHIFGQPSLPLLASLEKTPIRCTALIACQVVSSLPYTIGARIFASHSNPSAGQPASSPLTVCMDDLESR